MHGIQCVHTSCNANGHLMAETRGAARRHFHIWRVEVRKSERVVKLKLHKACPALRIRL